MSSSSGLLLLLSATLAFPARGDDSPAEAQLAPVERADDFTGKATASLYILPGRVQLDVNLRKRFGSVTGWMGAFVDPKGTSAGRFGVEYDFQTDVLVAVPALQVATNGLINGAFYAEIGRTVYGIAGFTFTNLKPLYNLTFDPNDAVELGGGIHLSRFDKLYAFTIFDVRLGTGQQDTHVLYRRKLDAESGLTLDVLYKSGHRDDGVYVRGLGVGLYFDRSGWFLKAYYDPWVNFTHEAMVRVGGGLKF
jgi:hypothetical protein